MIWNERKLNRLNDEITTHLNIISRCTIETERYKKLLLATPAGARYPYVYPRDSSSACQLFRRIAVSPIQYDAAEEAFNLMASMAAFIKDAQAADGSWNQRYSIGGEDKSIYKQEDNVAHGISILCNYLLTASQLNKPVADLEGYLSAIDRALTYSIGNLFQPELNLFYSTTSIHESAIEKGYTCWVNFAFLYAFSLAGEVADKMDTRRIISQSSLEFHHHSLYSIIELFRVGQRYVRRIDPQGNIDLRPDFTLLSPFYFGFLQYRQELEKSVEFLEKQLCDPEFGMIMRYLPFNENFATHVHAGNGPWLQYTAILAQFHFWSGNTDRGEELLQKIDFYANEDGEIPEHLSTCKRFEIFMQNEWKSGKDFAKEFHEEILLEHVDFDKILEETNNMASSYQKTGKKCMIKDSSLREGGYIRFATPLMWSHVEYIRALMIQANDWCHPVSIAA